MSETSLIAVEIGMKGGKKAPRNGLGAALFALALVFFTFTSAGVKYGLERWDFLTSFDFIFTRALIMLPIYTAYCCVFRINVFRIEFVAFAQVTASRFFSIIGMIFIY